MLLKILLLLGAVVVIVKPASAESEAVPTSLVVTSILDSPFLSKHETSTDEIEYEGYCADLVAELARVIGFNYTLKLVADQRYGRLSPNGTWNGMIGELINGEADIAVAPLTITSTRASVVDFSKPFMNLGVSIMIKKPTYTNDRGGFFFLYPFSVDVWLFVILICFVLSMLLGNYETLENLKQDGNRFSFKNRVWLRTPFQLRTSEHRSISCRVVNATWCLFMFFAAAFYIANLVAFMSAKGDINTMPLPVTSVEDLAQQTDIQYGTLEGGSTREFFRLSTDPIYQKMWKAMSSAEPSVFVKSTAEGVAKVRESRGKYAFLLESTMNDFVNQRKPCDTMRVGQLLNSKGYGIAMKAGSPLINQIDIALLRLSENGMLARLENKWWLKSGECVVHRGQKGSESPCISASATQPSDVKGLFYLVIFGIVLAFIIGVLEYVIARRKRSNPKKATEAKPDEEVDGKSVHSDRV